MNPQTIIKTKSALLILGIAVVAFGILVIGSYGIGFLKTLGWLIALYGIFNFVMGVYYIIAKKNSVMTKNSTIIIIGIIVVLIGAILIFSDIPVYSGVIYQ